MARRAQRRGVSGCLGPAKGWGALRDSVAALRRSWEAGDVHVPRSPTFCSFQGGVRAQGGREKTLESAEAFLLLVSPSSAPVSCQPNSMRLPPTAPRPGGQSCLLPTHAGCWMLELLKLHDVDICKPSSLIRTPQG